MNVMKKILVLLTLLGLTINLNSQVPSNDCAESPIIINACGTNFSITQAQMANATNDSGCSAGGSCPINYVNGVGYEDFDCDSNTGNSAGDDWNGTVENSLWWSFTTTESCSYTVTVNATNCCCKEKGSTSAAQVHIFNTTGTLPAGTILGVLANNSNFTGTQNFTISVTAGNPVLIGLDGLEGSDCDIDVSVMPGAGCTGCAVVMADNIRNFDVSYKEHKSIITWSSDDIDNVTVEHSVDGKNWLKIEKLISQTESNTYKVEHEMTDLGYNYYRIKYGSEHSGIKVVYNKPEGSIKFTTYYDIYGKLMYKNNLNSGIYFKVTEYDSGHKTVEKILMTND